MRNNIHIKINNDDPSFSIVVIEGVEAGTHEKIKHILFGKDVKITFEHREKGRKGIKR